MENTTILKNMGGKRHYVINVAFVVSACLSGESFQHVEHIENKHACDLIKELESQRDSK